MLRVQDAIPRTPQAFDASSSPTSITAPKLVAVFLVNAHGTPLEADIRAAGRFGALGALVGVPQALLPGPDGRSSLDTWWQMVRACPAFGAAYLVTNSAGSTWRIPSASQ